MREIPEGLARGPFTVAMGRELGLTDEVLSGRRFRAPWTGVRVMAEAPDTLVERCRAAVLALPADAVFSHDTAVALGGWLIPTHGSRPSATYRALEPDTGTPVHVTVPSLAGRPRGRGLVGHRADLAPGDVIVKDGLLITSPWRTWCDLAAGSASDLDPPPQARPVVAALARGG